MWFYNQLDCTCLWAKLEILGVTFDCNYMDFALKRMIIKILLDFLKGQTLEFIFRKSEVHAIEPGMLLVDKSHTKQVISTIMGG